MTERKALILVFITTISLSAAAFLVLEAIHAKEGVLDLVYIAALIGGAYTSSAVVMHYGSSEHRRR